MPLYYLGVKSEKNYTNKLKKPIMESWNKSFPMSSWNAPCVYRWYKHLMLNNAQCRNGDDKDTQDIVDNVDIVNKCKQ